MLNKNCVTHKRKIELSPSGKDWRAYWARFLSPDTNH